MGLPILNCHGGEGEIRTHGNLAATLDFESSAFDHSATSPDVLCDEKVSYSGRLVNFFELDAMFDEVDFLWQRYIYGEKFF